MRSSPSARGDSTTSMESISGRVALVTGASLGIGRAIAEAFAKAGVNVAVNYLRHQVEAEEACETIRRAGRQALCVQADVSKSGEVARLVKTIEEDLGTIEILVNNSGVTRPQPLEEIREEDWDELIAVNLKSAFLVTQKVVPGMRARRWGRIINVSSVAAHTGGVVGPHYAASKAGMLGLTHSYANLLVREGITVNAIAPALIYTQMVAANPRAKADLIPVGRFGDVAEVADVAVMLAGNGYITGQTINVDGGWYMT